MKTFVGLIFITINTCAFSFAQGSAIQWQKIFGGSNYEYVHEIKPTSNGGFISTGYSESVNGDVPFGYGSGDCLVIKTNSNGTTQWTKTYGGTGFDYGYSICVTNDGGYIVAGYSESNDGDVIGNHGNGDCWAFKLDSLGTLLWQKTFGGTSIDNGQSVQQTADGGYIIAGYSESTNGDVTANHGAGDAWVLKLDDSGNIEWQKNYGGNSYDFGQNIKQTTDGGYILTGETNSNDGDVTSQNGNSDLWLVKLDNLGAIIWQNSFGGSNLDVGQSVEQTSDEGYIVAGYSESMNGNVIGSHGGGDAWILKCDKFGSLQWQKPLGSSGNDYAFCIQQLTSGGYILTGYSELNDGDVSGNHGNYDCWVVRLDLSGEVVWQKSLGGSGVDIGYSIQPTKEGEYVLAAYSDSNDGDVTGNHGGGDCWLLTLNEKSVGIENTPSANSINVTHIQNSNIFNFSGLNENQVIEIYDVAGKLVYQNVAENSYMIIDLKNMTSGILIYSVSEKNERIKTGKILLY